MLTVLFLYPVLWGDELWLQRQHLGLARANHDWEHDAVGVASGMTTNGHCALTAVKSSGHEIARTVEGQHETVGELILGQVTGLIKDGQDGPRRLPDAIWVNRIQQITYLRITGDAIHAEQGGGVIVSAMALDVTLEAAEVTLPKM